MKLETKYDPEDEVFGLHKEEIVKAKILEVRTISTFEKNEIDYKVKLEGRKTPFWTNQSELYPTIDSLLETMKNKYIEKQGQ